MCHTKPHCHVSCTIWTGIIVVLGSLYYNVGLTSEYCMGLDGGDHQFCLVHWTLTK
jgi:hypothetical protein